MNDYIEEAIECFRTASVRYAKTERYYRGDHDLSFATEKFRNAFGALFREFALNLCPAICDSVADKLKVTGFTVQESTVQESAVQESAVQSPGFKVASG